LGDDPTDRRRREEPVAVVLAETRRAVRPHTGREEVAVIERPVGTREEANEIVGRLRAVVLRDVRGVADVRFEAAREAFTANEIERALVVLDARAADDGQVVARPGQRLVGREAFARYFDAPVWPDLPTPAALAAYVRSTAGDSHCVSSRPSTSNPPRAVRRGLAVTW